jgi:ArsR family transcriptional regulator, arsenate/arsenite/antimonite-responsive transcriptional repressor
MKELLQITKALSDGNRLRVVVSLMEQKELCVCQITEMLRLATATVSRHMSVLQNAGMVLNRKDGRWVHYRLSESFPKLLRQWIKSYSENSKDIEMDRKAMETILSYEPDDLCRKQKGGRCCA